jgi:hypothetical protein
LRADFAVLAGDSDKMDPVADRGVEAPGHGEKGPNNQDLLGPHAEAEMVKPIARAKKYLPWNNCLLQEFRYRPTYSLERHPAVSIYTRSRAVTSGHEPYGAASQPLLWAPIAESHRTPCSRLIPVRPRRDHAYQAIPVPPSAPRRAEAAKLYGGLCRRPLLWNHLIGMTVARQVLSSSKNTIRDKLD